MAARLAIGNRTNSEAASLLNMHNGLAATDFDLEVF